MVSRCRIKAKCSVFRPAPFPTLANLLRREALDQTRIERREGATNRTEVLSTAPRPQIGERGATRMRHGLTLEEAPRREKRPARRTVVRRKDQENPTDGQCTGQEYGRCPRTGPNTST